MLRLFKQNRWQAFQDYHAAQELGFSKKTTDKFGAEVIYWDDAMKFHEEQCVRFLQNPMDEPIKGEGFELIERV